jgi:hypothetical protein
MANKENSGALFKNGRKEKDTHPDMTGSINVNGTEYWLSAWKKDGKTGPYVSLAVKAKEENYKDGVRHGGGTGPSGLDDDLPF